MQKTERKMYSGLDLKVGGEGMKAFYSGIVPSAMSKLGKPFGAKVETIEIPETGMQQSIPVTNSMKETALEGMQLFESTQTFINFTPEEIQDETNKAHGSEENQRNSITKTVEAAISNTLLPDRGSAALREFGNAEQPVEGRDKRDNTNSPIGKRTVLEGFKESGYVDFVGTEVETF